MSRKFALSCALVLISAATLFAFSSTAAAGAPLYDAWPSYTISGTVRDWTGAPMAAIPVEAYTFYPGGVGTMTNAAGVYTLSVAAGVYRVEPPGYGRPAPSRQYVVVPPDVVAVDFSFPQTYTIAGTVRSHDGLPVAGASVSTAADDPFYAYAYTGASGAYSLTVVSGVYHLTVHTSGVLQPITATLSVPPGALDVDLQLPVRYPVSGRVRNWDGSPVSDAQVYAGLAGGRYGVAYTQTDAAGVYTLTLEAGAYEIGVNKAGLLTPSARQIAVATGQDDVDFTFLTPHTIRGTVHDWDGEALRGVSVAVLPNSWSLGYGVTDASGAYTVTAAAGTYDIVADKYPLSAPPAQTVTVPPDAIGVDFTFPLHYAIRGVVRYFDGTPAVGAEVQARTDDSSAIQPQTQSDAIGAYTLPVVAGAYRVRVAVGSLQAPPERLVNVPPDADGVDFSLPPHYAITGTVRNWMGAKVAWAGVVALRADDKEVASTDTGSTGDFTLLLNPGAYRLTARRVEQPAAPEQIVTVPSSVGPIDLVFPRPYVIRGIVRNSTGAPVRGADVYIKKGGNDGAATLSGNDGAYTLLAPAGRWAVNVALPGQFASTTRSVEVPPDAAGVDFDLVPWTPYLITGAVRDQYGQPVEGVLIYGGSREALTDANGVYTATARTDSNTSYLSAHKSGYQSVNNVVVPMKPLAAGVDFVLRVLDGTLSGQVLDPAGRPVAGAYVNAGEATCSSLGSGSYATTDASGAYAFALPVGRYRVHAYASGFIAAIPQEVQVGMAGTPTAGRADLTVTPAPFTISGRLLDSTGQPRADAAVGASMCGFSYSARGDVNGAYALPVGAGTYELSAWSTAPPPAQPAPARAEPGAAFDFTGESARLAAALPPGIAPQILAAAPVGQVGPLAVASSGLVASTAFVGAPGLVSVPPNATGVDVVLPPSYANAPLYALRGRVTDTRGQPLAGAFVSTEWPGRLLGYAYAYGSVLTDADGTFVLQLPAGAYRLSAYKSGYARPTPCSASVPPEQLGVDLVLTSDPENVSVKVSGVVRDSEARPMSYAYVCTEMAEGINWVGNVCQLVYYDGSYEITLEPGAYRLFAQDAYACAAASDKWEFNVRANLTGVDFTLRTREQLVSGQVTDALGRPVCGAEVAVADAGLPAVTSDGWGMYALPVPAGAYTLTATKPGYGRGADQPVTVPPRAAGVNFVLPLAANRIQGTVTDRAGAGLAGATVQVAGPVELDPTATGADGSYTVYVPDGAWRVAVNKPSYTAFPSWQIVISPPSPAQADFALVPDADVRRLYLPVLLHRGIDRR